LNPKIGAKKWENFIKTKWATENYIGYKATINKEIVGVILTIFSRRIYYEKEIKFCNISSIVVDPKYRNIGIANLLWNKIEELKDDYIITGFNPVKFTVSSY